MLNSAVQIAGIDDNIVEKDYHLSTKGLSIVKEAVITGAMKNAPFNDRKWTRKQVEGLTVTSYVDVSFLYGNILLIHGQ